MKKISIAILLIIFVNTMLNAGNNLFVTAFNIPVNNFTAIRVEKGITVILQQGETAGIMVEKEEDKAALNIRCNGNQLRLQKKPFSKDITVYVTCTNLDKIRLCYDAKLICNQLEGAQLELIIDENAVLYLSGSVDLIKSTTRNGIVNITGNYTVEKGLVDYNGRYTDIYTEMKSEFTQSQNEY